MTEPLRTIAAAVGAAGAVVLAPAAAPHTMHDTEPAMRATTTETTDRQQILDHIHSIFRAYVEKDGATIRATHSEDWKGFLSGSQQMIRGVDGYMDYAEQSLRNPNRQGVGYELLDVDVAVHGDVAIVYYLANYRVRAGDSERDVPLRSVDIYERRGGEWIQTGSNICSPPQDTLRSVAWPRGMGEQERESLLGAREAVWRAWFSADEAALREILPDETIAVNPGPGEWQGVDAIIAAAKQFKASGSTLAHLEFPRTEIQTYGPIAIIYTRYALRTRDRAGAERVEEGTAVEVFTFRDDRWRNSGWHLDRFESPNPGE